MIGRKRSPKYDRQSEETKSPLRSRWEKGGSQRLYIKIIVRMRCIRERPSTRVQCEDDMKEYNVQRESKKCTKQATEEEKEVRGEEVIKIEEKEQRRA